MKKINVIFSIIVLSVVLMACGNNDKPVPFNNPIVTDLRSDCIFKVEMINPIVNTDMNLVTVRANCPEETSLEPIINVLCPKTKQLVIGQKVTIVKLYYQQSPVVDQYVGIIQ